MSTAIMVARPEPATTTSGMKPSVAKSARRPKTTGGVALTRGHTPEAKRLAAAILEVLAGTRTPTEAAQTLSVSLPRYYQLETRALGGLLSACAARPKGRQRTAASEVAALRAENQRLQHEVTRQQSLARAAQRAVGLSPPAPPKSRGPNTDRKAGKKKRRRRVARALSVAQRLRTDESAGTPPTPEAPPTATP